MGNRNTFWGSNNGQVNYGSGTININSGSNNGPTIVGSGTININSDSNDPSSEKTSKKPQENNSTLATTTREIFISHSKNDKNFVTSFCNLLNSGLDISSQNIYCTSIPGQGTRTADKFYSDIKDTIKKSKIVVSIYSESYEKSTICLAELGAAWVLDKPIFLIALPPKRRSQIPNFLCDLQVIKFVGDNKDDAKSLEEFLDAFSKKLPCEKKLDMFNALNAFLNEQKDILNGGLK